MFDTTFFPLVFYGWSGATTEPLVDRWDTTRVAILQHAQQVGTKIICVVDLSKMQIPSSVIRKYVADKTLETDTRYPVIHEYHAVMPNAILRGVTTAVSWIIGDKGPPIRNSASMEGALAQVERSFRALGIDYPKPPPGYQIPGL